MTGVALAMGINERPKHEAYIQVAGKGHRLSADHLREALEASAALRQAILQYAHAFMTQMADTALSNGRQKIEERLARCKRKPTHAWIGGAALERTVVVCLR